MKQEQCEESVPAESKALGVLLLYMLSVGCLSI